MPGLGFRPLGYDIGGDVDKYKQVWLDFEDFRRNVGDDVAAMNDYLYRHKTELEMMAAENDSRADVLEGVKEWSKFNAFMKGIMPPESPPAFEAERKTRIEEGASIPLGIWSQDEPWRLPDRDMFQKPFGEARLSDQDIRRYGRLTDPIARNELIPAPTAKRALRRTDARLTDQDIRRQWRLADQAAWGADAGLGFGADVTPIEEMVTPEPSLQNLQAGGYVDRGTMAGELGRRGDLSVRQAGETMFERMKRMRGYAHGGYADGYSAPRGTVAGELPRYGDMSVREEGESMGELAKRHQDQDWYNHMGGGLGSLGRRRGIV